MTDDTEEHHSRSRRSSSVPRLSSPISEEPNSTIAALVNSNVLAESITTIASTNESSTRNRRRSSMSILQALVTSSHLLPTHDARKR